LSRVYIFDNSHYLYDDFYRYIAMLNIKKKVEFVKRFKKWFQQKPEIDNLNLRPFIKERDVWNCHWGCNVGFELDGKNDKFLRPVLILKKISQNTFIGIPLTTKLKNGSWYIKSTVQKTEGRYIIAQVRMIDAKRLYNKIERVPVIEFDTVVDGFVRFIQGKKLPPQKGSRD